MEAIQALTEAIVEMQEDKALTLTRELLVGGTDSLVVFGAYQNALQEIGKRFEKEIYYIPELMMSGEIMKTAMEIIKPYIKEGESENRDRIGKILIATVAGDIHDIGKNIVTMMMDLNGFEVLDLGVDVPSDKILEEAKAFGADIIGLSGLLTLAFDPMKEVVEKLAETGLRDKIKVIIGGGQMDDKVCKYTGADAYVIDAIAGVNICKEWVN
jgi:5-methyltetrahydrofolate--homocysteine methyltransferase